MIKGQNLVEIVIIIVLVAIAGILVLTFLGDDIKKLFETSSAKYSTNKPFDYPVTKTNNTSLALPEIKPGALGGTRDKPVQKCENGSCAIDFGNFTLSGVPENFNNYVDSVGTPGGTKLITDLLDQIIAQLESEGVDEAQILAIKNLSNIGHNFAVIEEDLEGIARDCNYEMVCVDKKMWELFPRSDELDMSLYSMEERSNRFQVLNSLSVDAYAGELAAGKIPDYATQAGFIKSFYTSLDGVKNSPALSQNMKDVIEELTVHYRQIGADMHDYFDTEHDFVLNSTKSIKDYNASSITNFDGSLICASGKFNDSGKVCH